MMEKCACHGSAGVWCTGRRADGLRCERGLGCVVPGPSPGCFRCHTIGTAFESVDFSPSVFPLSPTVSMSWLLEPSACHSWQAEGSLKEAYLHGPVQGRFAISLLASTSVTSAAIRRGTRASQWPRYVHECIPSLVLLHPPITHPARKPSPSPLAFTDGSGRGDPARWVCAGTATRQAQWRFTTWHEGHDLCKFPSPDSASRPRHAASRQHIIPFLPSSPL